MKTTAAVLAILLAATTSPTLGRIKLATLPQRERVEIQLDTPGYTLVEEERIVPLLKSTDETGNNTIDFSWSNVRIDPDTILFRPVAIRDGDGFRPIADGEVAVINVAYPPNENALVWEVYAREACAVKVRVSYLIGNLTREVSYLALADTDESSLALKQYLRLNNYSGEGFGDASVWAGFGPDFLRPIGSDEAVKMLVHTFDRVPIAKTYTFDWYRNGPLNRATPHASKVLMHYELTNDADHGMGLFPLPAGKARIFIEDARGGRAFLGEDMAETTPIDDTMRLYLGEARDVVCQRRIESNDRRSLRGNLHDNEIVIRYEIENFTDEPIALDIVEQINELAGQHAGDRHGDAEWEIGRKTSDAIEFDFQDGRQSPTLRVKLPARPADSDANVEKVIVRFHLTVKNLW